jgi:hypothetical protein
MVAAGLMSTEEAAALEQWSASYAKRARAEDDEREMGSV